MAVPFFIFVALSVPIAAVLAKRALSGDKVQVALGYRQGDYTPDMPEARHCSLKLTRNGAYDRPRRREVMQVSLGPHVHGVALPTPDVTHAPTVEAGARHRVGADLPAPDPTMLMALWDTSTRLCEWFPPIRTAELDEVEDYLGKTPYSAGRKAALLDGFNRALRIILPWHFFCKAFGKVETYVKWAYARAIISRDDVIKVVFGPAFKPMEDAVFALPSFIKHIPMHARPTFLMARFGEAARLFETDYTSYEASFHVDVMEAGEMRLYQHMLSNYPNVYQLIHDTMLGVNTVNFKWFTMKIPGRRMSGEMCTSLGNGWTNYVLVHLMQRPLPQTINPRTLRESPIPPVVSVHEGDDGLIEPIEGLPIHLDRVAKLGFVLKLEVRPSVLESKFCGLMMASDGTALCEPTKVLAGFGWTHSPLRFGGSKVLRGLLRAKALSLMCEFPQCPIVSKLAIRYVTLTEGTRARHGSDFWSQHSIEECQNYGERCAFLASQGPSAVARRAFAEIFGIGVELQLRVEAEIASNRFGPLRGPAIMSLFDKPEHDVWRAYSDVYVMDRDVAHASDWDLPM